jgi:hypothetical protein
MKRLWFVLAGLAVAAAQGAGPAPDTAGVTSGYEVTPALGPWMIMAYTYSGPEARSMALKLIEELRTNYKLPAYLFNYVDEERTKERERVAREKERIQKLLEEQKKYLDQMENTMTIAPVHIRTRRFEDQYGVLIGGYQDEVTARQELKRMKTLKPPDPKRVPLACLGILNPHRPPDKAKETAWLTPFAQAFVVPNPTVKRRSPLENPDKADPFLVKLDLKKLNAEETYNLFKCPKRYTLALVQFAGGTVFQSQRSESSPFLSKIGTAGGEPGEALNAAAMNAHRVAEFLRKLNLEAYVLHTRYASVVTVGGFDDPEEPALKAMQQKLAQIKLDPIPVLPQILPMDIDKYR